MFPSEFPPHPRIWRRVPRRRLPRSLQCFLRRWSRRCPLRRPPGESCRLRRRTHSRRNPRPLRQRPRWTPQSRVLHRRPMRTARCPRWFGSDCRKPGCAECGHFPRPPRKHSPRHRRRFVPVTRTEHWRRRSSIGLLATIARLRFTGMRRLTCTPPRPRQKATFLLCQGGDICTLPRHATESS